MVDGLHFINSGAGAQWIGQAAGYQDYNETDWLEDAPNALSPSPCYLTSTIHWWNFLPTRSKIESSTGSSGGVGCPNWSSPQAIQGVWIPSTGSTVGSLTNYINGVQQAQYTWTQCSGGDPPGGPPPVSPYIFCVADRGEFALVAGDGNGATPTPCIITVIGVDVWQTPAAAAADPIN
jgi:hypothetical protein